MSSLLATGREFISALSSLDVDRMLALRTSDCQQIILPGSLGRNPMSNDEFRRMYSGYLKAAEFADYHITVHSEMADERQGRVALHASGTAKTLAGPFETEYVFFLTMVEQENGGGKLLISKVEEFVDSKLSSEQGSKVRAAISGAN